MADRTTLDRSYDPVPTRRQRTGLSLGSKLIGVVVVAIVLALAWSLLSFLLGTIVLGLKIAIVLAAIVLVLTAIGWFRVNVLKH